MKYILGVSAFYHDSAAALLREGGIVATAQEERFTRKKYDKRFPVNAIRYCLREGRIKLKDVNAVVFYEKTLRKFKRIVSDFLIFAPSGFQQFLAAMPEWLGGKLFLDKLMRKHLLTIDREWSGKILFSEHHQAHAASAFYPSPFDNAVILVIDAVGEWASTSIHVGDGSDLRPLREQCYPHSLGVLYSAFTGYTGFKVNSGEYKMMGLAPYGEPKYVNLILDHLLDLKEDGSFHLDLSYFDFHKGLKMTGQRFHELFGGLPRLPESLLSQKEMDIAASIQRVTEEIVLRVVRYAVRETGCRNLCLAGGVALNCVANGAIRRSGLFDEIWIQPAAGDAGGALGAAYTAYHLHYGAPRSRGLSGDSMRGAFLGPSCDDKNTEESLIQSGAVFEHFENEEELLDKVADDLAAGLVIGWCQGRMEFGPRALGNRSILADPRDPEMRAKLNMKIKFRESFRPFAPAVLRDHVHEYFELDYDSPYMLLVAQVRKERCIDIQQQKKELWGIDLLNLPRSDIPAVTHVDCSARVQTINQNTNPRLHALLSKFKWRTTCAVLANTSFNVRGEPIVCDVQDAFQCFMGTNIDVLAIGNYYLRKQWQDPNFFRDYKNTYEPD